MKEAFGSNHCTENQTYFECNLDSLGSDFYVRLHDYNNDSFIQISLSELCTRCSINKNSYQNGVSYCELW